MKAFGETPVAKASPLRNKAYTTYLIIGSYALPLCMLSRRIFRDFGIDIFVR